MELNKEGLKAAMTSLMEAEQRVLITEREAIADAERADRNLNTARSLLGHIRHFRQVYGDKLHEIITREQAV